MSATRGPFHGQVAHGLALLALLAALGAARRLPGFSEGAWLGVSTPAWVALAVLNAVAHQVWVALGWRLELCGGRLTRALGSAAWPVFAAGFAVLIAARPLLAVALAVANAGTLGIDPRAAHAVALALALPLVWLAYSMHRWFGVLNAFGRDHFDPALRQRGLVRRGIFRYVPNAMYTVGFLALWIPPVATRSVAGLAVAAFSHAYVWVHWFCTEKPDLERLYGPGAE